MEVILSQAVKGLGQVGDVVKVKTGYARNFLIPKKMATVATKSNIRQIEAQQARQNEMNRQKQAEAEALAEKLAKASVNVAVEVNDLEKLYGSVTEAEIARALNDDGFSVDKKQIELEQPITELGIFDVNVKLEQGVIAKVRVWVTKK